MASTYEIIQGLHQAAANAHDGSQYEKHSSDGKARTIGLKREEGDAVLDSRAIDGFHIKISGNLLTVVYTADIKLRDVYMKKDFEGDMEETIEKIVSYLKKEYKDITKSTISLSPVGEVSVFVQPISRQRTTVEAKKSYTITSLKDVEPVSPPSNDITRDITRKFLEMGREKAKKPTNASFKNESLKKNTLSENVKNVVSIEGVNGELMHYTTKGTILLNGKDVTTQAKEEVAKMQSQNTPGVFDDYSADEILDEFEFSIFDIAKTYAEIHKYNFQQSAPATQQAKPTSANKVSQQPERSSYERDSDRALKAMSKL